MKKILLMILTISSVLSGSVFASSNANTEAARRYAEDRKLCAEESSSTQRMQCLRDAKSEYTRALASSRAAAVPSASPPVAAVPGSKICAECGKVLSVQVVEKEGKGGALGLIAGGVAGAVLGHQVGQGRGKDLATIAGAAGGAYAGHKIEQNVKATKSWVVAVRFETGEERSYNFDVDPRLVSGDAVVSSGNSLQRR